jgi:hypothetical protein
MALLAGKTFWHWLHIRIAKLLVDMLQLSKATITCAMRSPWHRTSRLRIKIINLCRSLEFSEA